MAADDFTLQFGSNAKQFARDLDRELAPVLASIREITESVRIFQEVSESRNTGSNAFVQQLADISGEIRTVANEARADVGATTQAMKAAATAIQGMQGSIQSLLQLFQNITAAADNTEDRIQTGNRRLAGARRDRQRFQQEEKDQDAILGLKGTANPFSRRTSGLSEGIKRLGDVSVTAGAAAREGASGIGALRDALRGMVRALPAASDRLEQLGGVQPAELQQINLTSDLMVGLAQALRDLNGTVVNNTSVEAQNTDAVQKQTIAEQKFGNIQRAKLTDEARPGRFVFPGDKDGESRGVGFRINPGESFEDFFKRSANNLEQERRTMLAVERLVQRSNENVRLLGSFNRKEIDRLRDPQTGVIDPSRFQRERASARGIAAADIDKIPAALQELARFEAARTEALTRLAEKMLQDNPDETFAGMSQEMQKVVRALDNFRRRQIEQRGSLLDDGQAGNSRFRVRGTPVEPDALSRLMEGILLRLDQQAEINNLVAKGDARSGAGRDADRTTPDGVPIGLRARQKAEEKSAADLAKFAEQQADKKEAIEKARAETELRILRQRAAQIKALLEAPTGTANGHTDMATQKDFQRNVETALTNMVSDLSTRIDRLNAREKAVRTALDDSPDAQRNAVRRVADIDRQIPAIQGDLAEARRASDEADAVYRASKEARTARGRLARIEESTAEVETRMLEVEKQRLAQATRAARLGKAANGQTMIGPRPANDPRELEMAAITQQLADLEQSRLRLEQQAINAASPLVTLSQQQVEARKRTVDLENRLYAIQQERIAAEERADRIGTLKPDEVKKLQGELRSLSQRRQQLIATLNAVNPLAGAQTEGQKNEFGTVDHTKVVKQFKPIDGLLESLSSALALVEAEIDKKVAAISDGTTAKGRKVSDKDTGASQRASRAAQVETSATRARVDEERSIRRKVEHARREIRAAEQRIAKAQVVLADEESSDKKKKSASNRLAYATEQLAKERARLAELEARQSKAKASSPDVRTGGGSRGRGGSGADSGGTDATLPRGKGPIDVRVVAITSEAARAIGRSAAGTTGPAKDISRPDPGTAAPTPVTPRVTANARQTLSALEQLDAAAAAAAQKSLDSAVEAGKDQVALAKATEQRMKDALQIVESLRSKGLRADAAIRVAADSVGFGARTPERAQFGQLARTSINLSSATKQAQELQRIFDSLPSDVRRDLIKVQRAIEEGLIPRSVTSRELIAAYRQFVSSPLLTAADATRVEIRRMFGQMFQIPPGVVTDISRTVAKINGAMSDAGAEAGGRFHQGFQRFIDRTFRAGSFFSVRSLAGSFVFGLENVFREAFTTALNAETEFVRVEEAMASAGQSARGLKGEFQNLSRELGVPLDDIQRSASQLVGVFNDRGSLLDATRTVASLQIISNGALDATEGFKSLTAVASAFGLEAAEDLEHIADVATALQNTLGTNVEDTLEGVSRLGAVADQFGLSLEQIAALTATASKFTGLSGQTISEQLGRVLSLFNTPKVQELLSSTFEGQITPDQFGTANGTGQAITTLIRGFSDLEQAQKNALVATLGGQRQFAILGAILGNSEESLRALTAAENAQGAAASRINKVMSTLRKEIDQLKASLVTLIAALADAGLFGALEVAAKATGELFSGIASILKAFNDMTENPVLGFVKSLTVAVLLLAAAYKVAQAGANFFKRGVDEGGAGARTAEAATKAAAAGAATGGGLRNAPITGNIGRTEFEARRASDAIRKVGDNVGQIGVSGRLASAGLARAATGIDAMGRAASITSGRLSSVGGTMKEIASSGALLDGALLGITIVMTSYLNLLSRENELRKSIAEQIKDRQNGAKPQNDREKRAEEADQFIAEAQDQTDGFFNKVGLGMSTIVKTIKVFGSPGGNFQKRKRELDALIGNGSTVEQVEEFNKAIDKFMTNAQSKIDAASPSDRADVTGRLARKLISKQDELVALVGDNPLIVANAFAITTELIADIEQQGADTAVGVKGLGNIAAVTQEQLDNLRNITDSLAGLNSGQLADQAGTIAEVISKTDLGKDPAIRALIEQLADPKLSGPARTNVRTRLLQAMTQFQLNLAKTGTDAEEIATALSNALNLGAEAAASAQEAQNQRFENLRRRAENQVALGNNDTAVQTFTRAIALNRQNAQGAQRGTDEFAQFVETDKELRKSMAEALYADALKAAKAQASGGATEKARTAGERAVRDIELKIAETANDVPGLLRRLREAEFRLMFKRAQDASAAALAAVPADADGRVRNAAEKLRAARRLKDPTAQNIRTIRLREAELALAVALAAEQAAQEATLLAGEINLMNKSVIAAGKKVAEANGKVRAAAKLPKVKTPKFPNQPSVPQTDLDDLANNIDSDNNAQDKADLEEQIRQAKAAARIAGIRNPLAKLQAELNENLRQQQQARAKGREGLPDYYRLVAEEKQLRQQIGDMIAEIASAERNLAIAIADAAGNTVRSARIRLRDAQRAARRARRQYGAASAEALNAQAQVVQAEAAARDAALADRLDSIDFNREFDKISSQQAIKQLQDILKQKNLTKQQRRDILRKIKSIEDEINSSNEGQFNIGEILMPTIYEVRRSAKAAKAGVNYQETNNTTNNVTISGADLAKVTALVTSLLGRQTVGRNGTTTGKV